MANSNAKPSFGTRTLHFGSSFAAGAMMLSRMNRSEISRYDDLVSDLCCLRTPGNASAHISNPAPQPLRHRTWMRWGISSLKSQG